ncbi:hypothetical protein [Pseudophaeobacter sp.]|uniref:hypothetical protein n=1 Tax=Pseudophaeobacter sp. TaxID=1971739 RepID=UPI0032983398
MSVLKTITLAATLMTLAQLPSMSLAYGGGEGGGGGGDSSAGGSSSQGLSNATTRSVVNIISRGGSRCGKLPPAYKCDCFRWVYKRAADKLAGNPTYSEAYQALERVERSLEAVVQQNRDTTQPIRRRALETYTPVKPASVPKVNRATVQAMDRAQTVLLRSPDNKQEHYARIAQAVNSNKVLLRSALLPGGMIRLANKLFTSLLRQS